MSANTAIKVAIWTDGMGTYQARCLDCSWKGKWHRKEPLAVEDAKKHLQHNDNEEN